MPGRELARDLHWYYWIRSPVQDQPRLLEIRLVFVTVCVLHEAVAQRALFLERVMVKLARPFAFPERQFIGREFFPPSLRKLKRGRHQDHAFDMRVVRRI